METNRSSSHSHSHSHSRPGIGLFGLAAVAAAIALPAASYRCGLDERPEEVFMRAAVGCRGQHLADGCDACEGYVAWLEATPDAADRDLIRAMDEDIPVTPARPGWPEDRRPGTSGGGSR